MEYYDISNRIAKFLKKLKISYSWGGYGTKGTLIYCCWECKMVQFFERQFRSFLQSAISSYHVIQQLHS